MRLYIHYVLAVEVCVPDGARKFLSRIHRNYAAASFAHRNHAVFSDASYISHLVPATLIARILRDAKGSWMEDMRRIV